MGEVADAIIDELFLDDEECQHDDSENGICCDCGAEVEWKNFKTTE